MGLQHGTRTLKIVICLYVIALIMCIVSFYGRPHHKTLMALPSSSKESSLIVAQPLNLTSTTTKTTVDYPPRIAIVIIMTQLKNKNAFEPSITSVECYAALHGYKFFLVDSGNYTEHCNQADFLFRRHCIAAHIINCEDYDWFLFLEPDITIVNPSRRIEEFIAPHKTINMIFYDRFFTYDIMAGSYLAKKTEWSSKFLNGWANFDLETHRNHTRDTDDGVFHEYIKELFLPEAPEYNACLNIWGKTTDGCAREIVRYAIFKKIIILETGRSWCRDHWLTDGNWSEDSDLMLHVRNKLDSHRELANHSADSTHNFYAWYDYFKDPLNLSRCSQDSYAWSLNSQYQSSDILIKKRLRAEKRYFRQKFFNVTHLREAEQKIYNDIMTM